MTHFCSNNKPKWRISMYQLTCVAEIATFLEKNISERANFTTEYVWHLSRDTSSEVFMNIQLEYKSRQWRCWFCLDQKLSCLCSMILCSCFSSQKLKKRCCLIQLYTAWWRTSRSFVVNNTKRECSNDNICCILRNQGKSGSRGNVLTSVHLSLSTLSCIKRRHWKKRLERLFHNESRVVNKYKPFRNSLCVF
jgi:hypothetical protein